MPGVAVAWSGGKDSAWAVHRLQAEGRPVAALITTVVREHDRVASHWVRRALVREQAAVLALPLVEVEIPWPCPNERYTAAWAAAVGELRERGGIGSVAFGDLFLRDVRAWREQLMRSVGLDAEFPLWGSRTDLLSRTMLKAGVEATLVALDPRRVDPRWIGKRWDESFLDALPPSVDPCGERGEFHTFVTGGPMFPRSIPVEEAGRFDRDEMAIVDLGPLSPVRAQRSPPTPCRNVCQVGVDGLCDGCGRSLAEIAGWLSMSDNRRQAVMARVLDWEVRSA